MKVMVIGSAGYMDEIDAHIAQLRSNGHEAKKAAYDDLDMNEYGICSYNRAGIKWSDIVHIFWDGRSIGTQFDIGMAFAMDKPIHLVRLNLKSLRNFVLQYDNASLLERVNLYNKKPKKVRAVKGGKK